MLQLEVVLSGTAFAIISGELHKQSNYVCFEETLVLRKGPRGMGPRSHHRNVVKRAKPARNRAGCQCSQTDLHLSETKEALIDAVSVLRREEQSWYFFIFCHQGQT